MAQPLTTQQLLASIIDQLEAISARGDFADAPSYVTDGLDASMRFTVQAKDWLEHTPTYDARDWDMSLGAAQLGVVRSLAA